MSAALDLQSLLAAGVHEVKNLLGQLTLSLDEIALAAPPAADRKIDSARFACRRVADRLAEILTLYKLHKENFHPRIESHSPADVIADLAQEARGFSAGRMHVECIAESAPPFWFFDRELVESALLNAVHNALRYAREHIYLSAVETRGKLVFTVKDDGPGFPSDLLVAPTDIPHASHQGSGLGLYFAARVAEVHTNKHACGHIELSNSESGAMFLLYLP